MTETRKLVRCPQCELKQFEGSECRRCGRTLPQPDVYIVQKVQDSNFSGNAPVLPLEEIKRKAVIHALRKSSSVVEAAERLQIGKSTLYRLMHCYGIMEPGKDNPQPATRRSKGAAEPQLLPEQHYFDL